MKKIKKFIRKNYALLVFTLFILTAVVSFFVSLSLGGLHEEKEETATEQSSKIQKSRQDEVSFSFLLASDMRKYSGLDYDSEQYFAGAAKAASKFDSKFMIVAGDLDPVGDVDWTIKKYLGENYTWYPVVGNHELPGKGDENYEGANIELLRKFIFEDVKKGPYPCENTTYSFDIENTHFAVINEYCNLEGDTSTDGVVSDVVYNWLENDLETEKEHVFVVGHEPAFPRPDSENNRLRHFGDSLDQYPENRDRFWKLLVEKQVDAYLCGHTHNFSIYNHEDVWQIDSGHARGIGDRGSRSTFVLFHISDSEISYEIYRMNLANFEYELYHEGNL